MGMTRPSTALVLALLAAACHRDEPMAGGKPLSYWKKEATQVSLFSFWNSDKNYRRHEAFRRLTEMGEPAVPTLVDLFRENDTPVTSDASNALATLGPRAAGAVPELLEILDENNPALQSRAAWILSRIGRPAEAAVPSLTRLLQHPNPRLREAVAQALAGIGGSGHVALERARTSDDARRREAAVHGMTAHPLDPTSRRDIVAAAIADSSASVRLRGVELLMTVRGVEAEALVEYLVKVLNDPDPRVNHAAHSTLTGYLQHGGATPRLLAAVLEGGDAESRANAAWELGNRSNEHRWRGAAPNDPAAVDALLGALSDADPKVRIYAGRALAYGDGPPSERGLRSLRRDMPAVEPLLGVHAARVLWAIARNVAEVKPAYVAGLADPAKWTRVATISAIADMGKDGETFVPHLERLLDDPDPEVRDRAEKILYAIERRRDTTRVRVERVRGR
jgi:HEAT repeat protein